MDQARSKSPESSLSTRRCPCGVVDASVTVWCPGQPAPPPLSELERHLAEFSYVGGHQASAADHRLRARLEPPPPAAAERYPSVGRWWRHLAALEADGAPPEGALPPGDPELLRRLGLEQLLQVRSCAALHRTACAAPCPAWCERPVQHGSEQ